MGCLPKQKPTSFILYVPPHNIAVSNNFWMICKTFRKDQNVLLENYIFARMPTKMGN